MENKGNIILLGLGIPLVLGLVHLINWLLAKGLIWIMAELFNINWYGKFWVVYVAVLIFSILTKSAITVKK